MNFSMRNDELLRFFGVGVVPLITAETLCGIIAHFSRICSSLLAPRLRNKEFFCSSQFTRTKNTELESAIKRQKNERHFLTGTVFGFLLLLAVTMVLVLLVGSELRHV